MVGLAILPDFVGSVHPTSTCDLSTSIATIVKLHVRERHCNYLNIAIISLVLLKAYSIGQLP